MKKARLFRIVAILAIMAPAVVDGVVDQCLACQQGNTPKIARGLEPDDCRTVCNDFDII